MEEVWREARWIMDALQFARDKQPTGGISISKIIDLSKEMMPEKPLSISSQTEFMPSPMPSPEPGHKHSGLNYQNSIPRLFFNLCVQFENVPPVFCRFYRVVWWGRILWGLPDDGQWLWLQSRPESSWAGPAASLAPLVLGFPGAARVPVQRREQHGRTNAYQWRGTQRGRSPGFHPWCPPGLWTAAWTGRWAVWRRRRSSVWRRKAKGGCRAVRQWLHPTQQADRAAAHHRKETGLLCENKQPGIPCQHPFLQPTILQLQSFTLHLTTAEAAQALIRGPLLLGRTVHTTTSTSTYIITGQRNTETLISITSPHQESVPGHTPSVPSILHRPTKGDQCQGTHSSRWQLTQSDLQLLLFINVFSFSFV